MGRVAYEAAQQEPRLRQRYLDGLIAPPAVGRIAYGATPQGRPQFASASMLVAVDLDHIGVGFRPDVFVFPDAFNLPQEEFLSVLEDHEAVHADHVCRGIPVVGRRLTGAALRSATEGMLEAYDDIFAYSNQYVRLHDRGLGGTAFEGEVLGRLCDSIEGVLAQPPHTPLERVLWRLTEELKEGFRRKNILPLT